MKLAVLGAGAWGSALATAFSPAHEVRLWTRDAPHARSMRALRENSLLPGIRLPASMVIESDLAVALHEADLAVIATPVAGLRECLRGVAHASADVLWACKGFEPPHASLPSQIAAQELPAARRRGVLTGPSFAQEVARGMPTAVTLASTELDFARNMAQALHTPRLRMYANDDVIGAEVGGAVKNVLAIAAGICDGLGFGLNARAALITRGLAEISRLGVALGGRAATLMGLAGMGDLILTCTGDLSRNRRVGMLLAEGLNLDQILAELGHVAEGVLTAGEAAALAGRMGVDMPITQAVKDVLDGRLPAAAAVEQLLSREIKVE